MHSHQVKISSFSFGVFSFFLSGFKNPSKGLDFYFSFAHFLQKGGGLLLGGQGQSTSSSSGRK
jgi:hypothetical protein